MVTVMRSMVDAGIRRRWRAVIWTGILVASVVVQEAWAVRVDPATTPAEPEVPIYSPNALDERPKVKHSEKAQYPDELRETGGWGFAKVRFVVDEHGRVEDPVVTDADEEAFGREAIRTLMAFEFEPGMKDGQAVKTRLEYSFDYHHPREGDDRLRQAKDLDRAPRVRFISWPNYPAELAGAGMAGEVEVSFMVTKRGNVDMLRVKRADHGSLSRVIADALMLWQFEPGEIKDLVYSSQVRTTFRLDFKADMAQGDGLERSLTMPELEWLNADQQPVALEKLTEAPQLVRWRIAPLPLELRKTGLAGEVEVEFLIAKDGRVVEAHPVRASDWRLAETAVRSVRDWRFTPGRVGDEAVALRLRRSVSLGRPGDEKAPDDLQEEGAAAPSSDPVVTWDEWPKLMEAVDPEFPKVLERVAASMNVNLRCTITADGRVTEPMVEKSDNAALDDFALATIRRWTFSPALKEGQPVKSSVTIRLQFHPDPQLVWKRLKRAKALRGFEPPIYPRAALLEGREGKVKIAFSTDAQGRVTKLNIKGRADPDLAAAAVAAVSRLEYGSTRLGGSAKSKESITLHFELKGGGDAVVSPSLAQVVEQFKAGELLNYADWQDLDNEPQPRVTHTARMPLEGVDGWNGREVQVEMIIDANGVVRLPVAVGESNAAVAAAAVHAAGMWRFDIPRVQGEPVVTRVTVPVRFEKP